MKRIHLVELEDLSWFPAWLRTCMTHLLVLLNRMLKTHEVLADLLSKTLKEQQLQQIVDLGSGSGGSMPEVLQELRSLEGMEEVTLTLTDLYPNEAVVGAVNNGSQEGIQYKETPVDATQMEAVPQGLKTMVNSFHHMTPTMAKHILESARNNRQPLLIYELTDKVPPIPLWWLLLPVTLPVMMVMTLLMTPFVRPMTAKQLVFTYLLPVIPFCYAWDGQVSSVRIYTEADILELVGELETEGYRWEIGQGTKRDGKKAGLYVLGLPK